VVVIVIVKFEKRNYRNPNPGLVTKTKACKSAGQKGSLGVTFHVPRSAKECEGMNPHTPKGTFTLGVGVPMDSRWTSESSERDCRVQISLDWSVPYIIKKLLKRKCLKWARMTSLDICNTSYSQMKGRESNWKFDSQPLKVENRLNFLAWKWHATYHWKAFDEGYNFVLDLISIRGLHAKLWACEVTRVPGQNAIWMWASCRGTKYTIKGKVVASPKFGPWWVLRVRVCLWFVLAPKVLKLCTN
jgi:hypothetical protein